MSGILERIPHFPRPSLAVSEDEAVVALLARGAPLPAIPAGNRGLVGEREGCLVVVEVAGAAREDFLEG